MKDEYMGKAGPVPKQVIKLGNSSSLHVLKMFNKNDPGRSAAINIQDNLFLGTKHNCLKEGVFIKQPKCLIKRILY